MPQRIALTPPATSKYRVTNWPAYNRALIGRGSLTLWIDADVLRGWRAQGGKGRRYSDLAIRAALCLRAVFRLALRQTQGFLESLKRLMRLTIDVPHYSTLSRRAEGLDVPSRHKCSTGPLSIAIDSTGLKVFGEGEWHMRQHGKGKRRVWRKLHLAVDTKTGHVLAHELTPSTAHDGPELPGLLAQIDGEIDAVSADKAYDSFANHKAILARDARPVIPTRKGAAITPPPGLKNPPPTRGQIVKQMIQIGRKAWKIKAGYHRRSLSETAMYRYKTTLGPALKNRKLATQKAEANIGIHCLNTFTKLGMPVSIRIA